MTRINTVPVTELVNLHLMAEFRELPRIFTDVRKRMAKGQQPSDINQPAEYKLGTGHCMFFMDKCGYLLNRYNQLFNELVSRGYKLNPVMFLDIVRGAMTLPAEWLGDYQPDVTAMEINRARISDRLNGVKV